MYNNSETSGNLIAILPKLVDGLSGKQLSFWTRGTGSDMIVGVMTDPTDASTFAAVDTIIQPSTTTSQYNVVFSSYIGSGKYVAFKHGMTTTYDYFNIDDVYLGTSPTVNLGNDTTICTGSSITLDAGAGYTYSWTNNGYATEIATTQTINPDSIGTYVVKVMDASLFAYDTIVISNYVLPTVALTGNNTICNGDSSQLSMTFTGATPWDIVFSANGTSNTSTGLTSPFNTYDDPSTTTEYFITQITDANGCIQNTNSDSITITVNALPVVGFATLNDACLNDNVNLVGGTPTGGTYSGNYVNSTTEVFNTTNAGVGIHTVTYTYTDGNSCTDSAQQTQSVNALPNVTFSTLNSVCIDDASFSLSGGNPATGTYSGTGVSNGNFDPAISGAGSFDITYSYTDANSCTNTAVQAQGVNDLPTVSLILNDICADATTFSLSGGSPTGGTYTGTGVDGSGNFDPTNGTQSITYTLTDANGCTDSASANQVVNDLPNITVTAGTNPVPYNTATTLSASVSNGIGTLTYNWTPGTSVDDSTILGPNTINIVAATDFSVEVTDGTTNCVNSNNLLVSYSGGPVSVSPSADNIAICNGDTATLNAGGSGGTAALTYTWTSNPSGFTSTDESPEAMPTVDTWYIVEATDGNNTDKDSIQITVNALPSVSFTGLASTYCENDNSSDLTANPSGGIFNGTGINGSSFNPMVAGAGNFDITYSYTDGNGCSNTAVNSTVVNSVPSISFTGLNATSCANDADVTLTPTPSGGTFSGTGISGNVFSASTAGAGSYDIIYSYTDGNSCTNTDTNSTLVNSIPNPSFTGLDADYCIDGMNDTLTSLPSGGTFSGTGIIGDVFSPSTAGAGSFDIVYSYTDANGCSNTDTNSTTVNALPIISFTGLNTNYCVNDNSTDLVGNPSGGTFSGTGISGANFNPTTAGTGNFDIVYSYTDGNGCTNSDTNSTIVNALPSISFSGLDATYCENNANDTLIGLPSGGSFTGTGISGDVFSPSLATAGSFDIIYTFTDANNCTNSDTNSTVVNSSPSVSFTGLDANYCANASDDNLTGLPNGGTFSGTGIIGTDFSPSLAGAGSFDITYSYTDANGCTNIDTNSTVVDAVPMVSASDDTTICEGNTIIISATNSTAPATLIFTTYIEGSSNNKAIEVGNISNDTISLDNYKIFTNYNGNAWSSDNYSFPTGRKLAPNELFVLVNDGATTDLLSKGDDTLAYNAGGYVVGYNGDDVRAIYMYTSSTDSMMIDIIGRYDMVDPGSGWDVAGVTDATKDHTLSRKSTITSGNTNWDNIAGTDSLSSEYLVTAKNDYSTLGTFTITPSSDTYLWSNGATTSTISVTPSANTTYTVTVSNTNCSITDTVIVTVNALPIVSFSGLDANYCQNDADETLSGLPSGGTFSGTGINGSLFSPNTAGVGSFDIVYSYTNASGCSNTDTNSTIVNGLPSITVSNDTSVCFGDSTQVTLNFTGASPWSYDVFDGDNIYPQTASTATTLKWIEPDTSTNYVLKSITDGNNCTVTGNIDSIFITVNSLPSVTASDNDTICFGDSTQISLNFTGASPWAFTVNANGTSFNGVSPNSLFQVYDNSDSTTKYVITSVTDANACNISGNIDSVQIMVNQIPNIVVSGLDASYCINANEVTLTATPSGGTFTGTGINGNTFSPTNAGAGSFDIAYSVTDVNGCFNTDTNSTIVYELPSINVSATVNPVAYNNPTNITANISNAYGNLSYSWTPINNIYGSTFGQTITTDSIQLATAFYVTVFDSTSICQNMDTITITYTGGPVSVNPSIDVSDICLGDSISLSAQGSGGSGTLTYVWTSNPSGYASSMENPTATPTVDTWYIVTATDGSTTATDSVLISVHALPIVTFSSLNDSYCNNEDDVTLVASPTGGIFSGNGVNDTIFSPANAALGFHNIVYTYTDSNACSSSAIDTTNVFATPVVTLALNEVCANGSTFALSGGSPMGGTYSGIGVMNGSFNPSMGTQDITYSYTSNDGCTDSTTMSQVVNALPSITTVAAANPVDYDSTTTISALVSNAVGGLAYSWSPSSAISGSNTLQTITTTNVVMANSFIVNIMDSATNCANSDTLELTYIGGPVSINPIATPTTICSGDSVLLKAQSAGGTGAITYDWTSVPSGFTSTDKNPKAAPAVSTWFILNATNGGTTVEDSVLITVNAIPVLTFTGLDSVNCENASVNNLVASPTGGVFSGTAIDSNTFDPIAAGIGTFDIVYSYTDTNGCASTVTNTTIVSALPTVSFTGLDATYCENDMDASLVGTPTGGTYTGTGITGTSFSPSTAGVGAFDIMYVFTDANGCASSDTNSTIVNAAPMVDLGADQNVCNNHTITLDAGNGFASYLWSNGATTQSITLDSNDFDIGNNDYSVEVTNSVSCNNSDTVTLIVDPCTGILTPVLTNTEISIFPNPTKGQFQIDISGLENQSYDLGIYNAVGSIVFSNKVEYNGQSTQSFKIDFSTYPKGIYFVRLQSEGQIMVKRVIIQ